MAKVIFGLGMTVKEKSVKSVLAELDAAFENFRETQAAKLPSNVQNDYRKGCDYSREYATVIPRSHYFDLGFQEGRAFSKEWFHKRSR